MKEAQGGAAPIKKYKKGDIVLREGEPCACMYKVLSGSVTLYSAYGTEQALPFLRVSYPCCFGEVAMLSGAPSPYTAVAEESAALMRVSGAGFEAFLKNDAAGAVQVMESLAQTLLDAYTLLRAYQAPAETAEAETPGAQEQAEEAYYTHRAERLAQEAARAAQRAAQIEAAAKRAQADADAARAREKARKEAEAEAAAQAAAKALQARRDAEEAAAQKAAEAQEAEEAARRARAAADEAAWKTAQAQAAAEAAERAQQEAERAARMASRAQAAAEEAQAQAGVKLEILPPAAQGAKSPSAGIFLPEHKGYPGLCHPEYRKYTFEKKMACPHCKGGFTGLRILHSKLAAAPGAQRPRYDLRPRHRDFQVEWYALITCPHCGFSAPYSSFAEPKGLKRERYDKALREAFASLRLDFHAERDIDFVFAQHYLALLCAEGFTADAALRSGQLWMNLNWLYEDVDDADARRAAQARAMEHFARAYTKTRLSPVQEQRICMMAAAMEYEAGSYDKARDWAFRARTNRAGKSSLIKLAEDLIDDVRMKKGAGG